MEPGCENGKLREQRHKRGDRRRMSHPEGKGDVEVQRAHGLASTRTLAATGPLSGKAQRGLLAERDEAYFSPKGCLVPYILILQCRKCALRVKPWD